MNRLRMITMCLLAMMAASLSVKAQEVTITLFPGWNWISYPNSVAMGVNEALGTFTPMDGDKIKGQFSNSFYNNGYWRGGVTHFMPGMGYMYYSSRNEVTSFVFTTTTNSIVMTNTPTDITAVSAVVGGTVTLAEGNHVFARGLCWDTDPLPNIDGNHTINATITGSLSDTLIELVPNTTYYVRAYVVTDYGLAYGEEQSFTTFNNSSNGNAPEGAINGLFTINANGDQVYFSQGNLQYIGSANTPYWKFADNQWDYLGDNGQEIDNQYVDRDLFGWGTSGYNHGAFCYQPWHINLGYSNYYAYGNVNSNLYDWTGQADWGYNPISNGGNTENSGWRTLTTNEWIYVFNIRSTTSDIRFAKANIDGVNGVILVPDNWNINTYTLNNTNTCNASFNCNTLTSSQWSILEQAGAIFLPAAGNRSGTSLYDVDNRGCYWSASYSNNSYSHQMNFGDSYLYPQGRHDRAIGSSVRLVRNAE